MGTGAGSSASAAAAVALGVVAAAVVVGALPCWRLSVAWCSVDGKASFTTSIQYECRYKKRLTLNNVEFVRLSFTSDSVNVW